MLNVWTYYLFQCLANLWKFACRPAFASGPHREPQSHFLMSLSHIYVLLKRSNLKKGINIRQTQQAFIKKLVAFACFFLYQMILRQYKLV